MLYVFYWLILLGGIIGFYFILGYFLVQVFQYSSFTFRVFILWGMPLKVCASMALWQVNLLIKTSVKDSMGLEHKPSEITHSLKKCLQKAFCIIHPSLAIVEDGFAQKSSFYKQ